MFWYCTLKNAFYDDVIYYVRVMQKWSDPVLSLIQNALVSSDMHLSGGALIKQIILEWATGHDISGMWFLWYEDWTVQVSKIIPETWYLYTSIWYLSVLMQVSHSD